MARTIFVGLGLLLVVGCGAEGVATVDKRTAAEKRQEQDLRDLAAKKTKVNPDQGAGDFAVAVLKKLAEHQPRAAWDALPTKRQEELAGWIRSLGGKYDPEVWDKTIVAVHKLCVVLREKREFVLANDTTSLWVKALPSLVPLKHEELTKGWDKLLEFALAVLESDAKDLEQWKKGDIATFLDKRGPELSDKLVAAWQALDPDKAKATWEGLKSVTATAKRKGTYEFLVTLDIPGRGKEAIMMAADGGQWIPEKLRGNWPEWKRQMEQMLSKMNPEEMAKGKPEFLATLAAIDAGLDTLRAAKTQEEFNARLKAVLTQVQVTTRGAAPEKAEPKTAKAEAKAEAKPKEEVKPKEEAKPKEPAKAEAKAKDDAAVPAKAKEAAKTP